MERINALADIESGLQSARVELWVKEWHEVPPPSRISLLLAMPRPKNMRRIWWVFYLQFFSVNVIFVTTLPCRSILGQLGVNHIYVTNANKVERFYFDCQALQPEVIRSELLAGMEQVSLHLFPPPL